MNIREIFEKRSILFKFKEDEDFNRPDEKPIGTCIHTLGILRIYPPKFGGGLKSESDAEIGQKGMLFKDLMRFLRLLNSMPGPVPRHRL